MVGHDEDLLPEVSWDVVNILNHTRRGWCDSWDFKMINEGKGVRHQCHPLVRWCNYPVRKPCDPRVGCQPKECVIHSASFNIIQSLF